jgi:hypothetical protein
MYYMYVYIYIYIYIYENLHTHTHTHTNTHTHTGGPELEFVARPPGSPMFAMPEDKVGRSLWRSSMRGLEVDGESTYGSLVDFRFEDNNFFWSPPPEVVVS